MNEALRSVFGDNILGIATLVVMLVFIAPKFMMWWRARRQKKRSEAAEQNGRIQGLRALSYAWEKPAIKPDASFGAACAELRVRRGYVFCRATIWLIPVILNILMPVSWAIRMPLFALTLPLMCIGLWGLSHLLDRTVFYETGFVTRAGIITRRIDYNLILNFEKRSSTFSGATINFIFYIEDESPIDFVCARYEAGARTIARVIKGMSPRQIRSEAAEVFLRREN